MTDIAIPPTREQYFRAIGRHATSRVLQVADPADRIAESRARLRLREKILDMLLPL